MTTEEKLKEYILDRYKSIREFTQTADISYSTLDSMLKRGIDNSSVSKVIKVCKVLGISADELADGRITPINLYKPTQRILEVSDILADVKNQLIHSDGLTIEGKPADKDSINSIVQAVSLGEELAKRNKS